MTPSLDVRERAGSGPPEPTQVTERRLAHEGASGRRGLLLVLGLFLGLGLVYSLLTPVFEGPDEPWHFAYVRHLAREGALPRLDDPAAVALLAQQVGGPPLYYAVVAAAVAGIDMADFPDAYPRNSHFTSRVVGTVADNKNRNAHTDREDFPWRGSTLAVRLGRLVTLLLGMVAVVATYGIAGEVWPAEPRWAVLAAVVTAATPMFLFVAGMISNDAPAAAWSGLALWVMAAVIRRGATRARLTWLALALAAAWLTKVSTLALAAPALLSLWWAGAPVGSLPLRHRLATVVGRGLYVLGLAGLVAGWWFARNALLFGDPAGVSPHFNTVLAHRRPTPLLAEIARLPDVWSTYWAAFGWGNILLPDWVYALIAAFFWLAVVGLTWLALGGARRPLVLSPQAAMLWTLVTAVALIVASLVRWMQQVEAPHGRLLYPAIAAISVLLVAGWRALAVRLRRPALAALPVAALVVLAVGAPLWVLRPAYARPVLLSEAEAASLNPRLDWEYGDVARLVTADILRDRLSPGQTLPVRLCWEPLQRSDRLLTVFVQLIGQGDRLAALHHSYPGRGSYPTTGWQPGRVFCDTLDVLVPPDEIRADQPEVWRVEVGLFDVETGRRLPVRVAGQPRGDYFVGQVKTLPATGVASPPPSDAPVFGEQLRLVATRLSPTPAGPGQPVTVSLTWQAARRPDADYQVFLHLLDAEGRQIGAFDGPPVGGRYATSWWDAGEVVVDEHTLTLPSSLASGAYTLQVGLYRLDSGERLPLTSGATQYATAVTLDLAVR